MVSYMIQGEAKKGGPPLKSRLGSVPIDALIAHLDAIALVAPIGRYALTWVTMLTLLSWPCRLHSLQSATRGAVYFQDDCLFLSPSKFKCKPDQNVFNIQLRRPGCLAMVQAFLAASNGFEFLFSVSPSLVSPPLVSIFKQFVGEMEYSVYDYRHFAVTAHHLVGVPEDRLISYGGWLSTKAMYAIHMEKSDILLKNAQWFYIWLVQDKQFRRYESEFEAPPIKWVRNEGDIMSL